MSDIAKNRQHQKKVFLFFFPNKFDPISVTIIKLWQKNNTTNKIKEMIRKETKIGKILYQKKKK